MSKVIDNRVVSMEFDNSQFEKGVQTSMKTLDNLNRSLDSLPETSGKGLFKGFSKAANNMDLSGISSGIDAINSKFSALGIAGQEVIRSITRSAMAFGKNAWNMTFGQITSGGKRRSENIANARFTLEGMGLNFEDYRKDIDYAVDGTAYGFDQAAKAASVFASSGVKAGDDMKKALRGISGVAAMTNADFDEIAYVFEKVNGMGKVTGETLNMINGRGLNATAALGKALGKTEEEIHKMVSKGQIDFATFSKAMDDAFGEHAKDADKTFGGVTKNIRAQLSRIGQAFYDPLLENDSGLIKMLQSVKSKIKEVKAVTDPFATRLAEEVLHLAGIAKGFIDSFDASKLKPVFDFLIKGLEDVRSAETFILDAAKGLGGIFKSIFKVGKGAFKEIFPNNIDKPITNMAEAVRNFVGKLVPAESSLDKLKRIFKGLFSIVSLGIKIFKDLTARLAPLTSNVKELGSKLFDTAAKIGDFFTELNENYEVGKPFQIISDAIEKIKSGFDGLNGLSLDSAIGGIKEFLANVKQSYEWGGGGLTGVIRVLFDTICDGIALVISWIEKLTGTDLYEYTEDIVDKICNVRNAVMDFVSGIDILDKVKSVVVGIKTAFSNLWTSLEPIRKAVKTVLTPLWEAIKQIGSAIKEGLSSPGGFVNLAAMMVLFEHLRMKALNLKFAFQDFKKFLDFSSGKKPFDFLNNIDKTIGAAKSALFQLTKELKAKAILEIAGAIAILAVSFMLLASIDSDKIAQAGLAMVGLLGAMAGLLKEMDTLGGGGVFKDASKGAMINNMGNALIKMSVAVLILAAAMKALDGLENVGQDILAFAVVLGALIGAAYAINKLNIKSFNKIAIGMILLAFAVKILASAMKSFDGLDWDDVGQGLLSITILMAELVIAAVAINKWVGSGVFTKVAFGMILMATAVKMLATAVQALGQMQPEQLAAGIVGVSAAVALLILAVGAIDNLISGTDFAKISVGFLLLGASLMLIATAFRILGNMDDDAIVQAFMVLAITLAGLTVVLLLANNQMLAASVGILILSAAMLVFTAAIGMLGSMDLMTLIKGMSALAVGLIVLAVALNFIQGSILGAAALLIVAVALVPFAAALMMLTSLNLADLAGTILVLVVALAALVVVCYAMTGALIGAAALLVLSVALLAFGVACSILTALPLLDLAATLGVVALALLGFAGLSAILTPLLIPMAALAAVMLLISAAIAVLGAAIMVMAMGIEILSVSGAMGANALLMFCTVLGSNMKILVKGTVVITSLASALVLFDAALLIAAVSIAACAVALTLLSTAMLVFAAAAVVFSASLLLVATSLKTSIMSIKELLNEGEFRSIGANAMTGIVKGFQDIIPKAVAAAKELGQKVVDGLKDFGKKLVQIGKDAIMGFVNGLKSKLSDAKQAAATVGQGVLTKLKSTFKIKSPSRETMAIGELVDEGLAKGISDNANLAEDAADDMASSTIDAMSSALSTISNAMSSDAEPTITPVMDLSEIQNGVNTMNGLLDQKRVANISANYNAGRMYEQEQMAFNQAQMANLGSQLNAISSFLSSQQPTPVDVNVTLAGDADGVFKLVQQSNSRYSKMHGRSAFA